MIPLPLDNMIPLSQWTHAVRVGHHTADTILEVQQVVGVGHQTTEVVGEGLLQVVEA